MTDQKITDDDELDEEGKLSSKSEDVVEEEKEGETEEETKEKEEEKDEEIPVRRSAEQHIIARQKKTIEKLRSKKEEEESYEPEPEEEDAKDIDRKLDEKLDRKLGPVLGALRQRTDEEELQALISREPEAQKYEARVRKWMAHPKYDGVPPDVIFHHLAFDSAAKIRQKRRAAADTEASHMRGGGNPIRPKGKTGKLPTPEEVAEMDEKEFEELQHQVQRGTYVSRE